MKTTTRFLFTEKWRWCEKKCSARNCLPVLLLFKWQSGACSFVKWPAFSFIQARRLEMKYFCPVKELGFYGKKRPITHWTWLHVGFVLCANPCHPLGLHRIALKMAICEAPVPAFTDNNCWPSTPGPGAIETFSIWKELKDDSQLYAIRSEMCTNWRITCDGPQSNEMKVGALSC